MSWLYSRALVAASSPATCSAGAPSAPLSVMPTQHKFWRNDKTMEPCDLSRFGLTCAVLTADRGEAVLTWCLEDSLARTSAWPEKAQESKAPAAECGATWRASWAKFDPDSSTWRTAQPSLLGDSDESSVTWPRSGMTAGGLCWELPMSAPPISATGSGLWLQTPIAAMAKNTMRSAEFAKGRAPSPQEFVKQWPTPTVCGNYNRKGASKTSGDGLATAVANAMWPTPTSSLGTNGGRVTPAKAREGGTLIEALSNRTAWPTPDAHMGSGGRTSKSPPTGKRANGTKQQITLNDAVKWATPTARDWRSGKASQATHDKNSRPLSEQAGGSLNPTWVEWLMGWPLGWTDLKPLETARCPCAPPPLGECSQPEMEPA